MIVYMYTDGACSGNPGAGGWGVVLYCGQESKTLSGAALATTNNRMELTAAISGLQALTKQCKVELFTDSKYVMDGITLWINKWKQNNWKTAANKPVKNQDLWQALDIAMQGHMVTWHWVKGHSGHLENEKADQLARAAITTLLTGKA